MGISSWNPMRPHNDRTSALPVYESLVPGKDRDSNASYNDSDDDDDNDDGYSTSSSPSTRNTSASSATRAAPIMPKRRKFLVHRSSTRPLFPRLPNKIVRYICLGLISLVVLMILSLIRASQNENRALIQGKVEKLPAPPPIWESFEFLTRYYGGVRNLVPFSQNQPEYPRLKDEMPLDKLEYVIKADAEIDNDTISTTSVQSRNVPSSKEFIEHPQSVFKTTPEDFKECHLDKEGKLRVPPVRYYNGRPNGFPDPVLGSYELLGLLEDICCERFGRYGPYGFGYSKRTGGLGVGENGEREGSELTWEKVPRVDWRSVDWADTQRRCYRANSARYKSLPFREPTPHGFFIDNEPANATIAERDILFDRTTVSSSTRSSLENNAVPLSEDGTVASLPRTAIVIRCWDEYLWREEDVMNIRSLITEMVLASGGRYDVHLLVQVKNDARFPIWADSDTYRRRIEETIPAELRGIVTLWTETQMLSLYQGIYDLFARGPGLPIHGVYRGLQMAMQYFAYQHPEYDYFWQWEMDIRYTGHYYDFFSKVENWAKEQPRKGLWERNARFYLPSVHGPWEDFKQMTRVQAEMGIPGADNIWNGIPGADKHSTSNRGDKIIWGPERPLDDKDWYEPDDDPVPPISYEKDKYIWGSGEEPDYITFNPMFDPEGTTWGLANDITGYNTSDGTSKPPRRAQIITASRMSRRLLRSMHRETAFLKHHAFPEMWPGTVALQHGYKAVFVPHPIYVDREWPTQIFAQTLNNGKNGASGGSRTSVFGDREHNLIGLSWFYNSGFAPNLYRRWLGLKVNNDGGEEFELTADDSKDGSTVGRMRGGEGRMCLPPMLLHPIKEVELPVESLPEGQAEIELPESDPGA